VATAASSRAPSDDLSAETHVVDVVHRRVESRTAVATSAAERTPTTPVEVSRSDRITSPVSGARIEGLASAEGAATAAGQPGSDTSPRITTLRPIIRPGATLIRLSRSRPTVRPAITLVRVPQSSPDPLTPLHRQQATPTATTGPTARSAAVEGSAAISAPRAAGRGMVSPASVVTSATPAHRVHSSPAAAVETFGDSSGALGMRDRGAPAVRPPAVVRPGSQSTIDTADDMIWRARADAPAPVSRDGAEFLEELSRHRAVRPQPLPRRFEPVAAAIVGTRPVHLATSAPSRRALARVGKRAATTGDTIHVSTPHPTPEVIAHELVHIANPSPLPRFFDDVERGPEERVAEQVAAVIRRSPVVPRTGVLPRRSHDAPAASVARASSPGTISASGLAASITRGSPATPVVRRVETATPPQAATTTQPHDDQTAASTGESGVISSAPTSLLAQFDRIVELLEDRIINELERRGGRFRGGF
jgi:hypothetical protein